MANLEEHEREQAAITATSERESWEDRAQELVTSGIVHIVDIYRAWKELQEDGHETEYEGETFHDSTELIERAEQMALSVRVRCGWHTTGNDDTQPEEFEILLSTGGPASRIYGTLDDDLYPDDIRFEVQDWYQPWTRGNLLKAHPDKRFEKNALEWFVQCFWFGS